MVYLAHLRTAFALSNGTYGSPRMHRDLVNEGHEIGRHRTARLMRENQLVARQKRRFKRTTDSEHAWPVAPKLVAQDFTTDGPDRKWGADISYIWTAEGWLYRDHRAAAIEAGLAAAEWYQTEVPRKPVTILSSFLNYTVVATPLSWRLLIAPQLEGITNSCRSK
jgi:transposase InsO family protein